MFTFSWFSIDELSAPRLNSEGYSPEAWPFTLHNYISSQVYYSNLEENLILVWCYDSVLKCQWLLPLSHLLICKCTAFYLCQWQEDIQSVSSPLRNLINSLPLAQHSPFKTIYSLFIPLHSILFLLKISSVNLLLLPYW